jgi:hypothetical protein
MSTRRSLVVALIAGVLVAGCGDDDPETVDAAQIEEQIEQGLSSATAKVASVTCPDDVESEAGAKFTCSAKLDKGGSAKVEVTQQDDEAFTYSVKPGSVKIAGATVDEQLEQDLAASGAPNATVNCPDPVTVKTGTTVTCPVVGAGGGQATVSFEFTDESGSVDQSSVETGQ